MEKPISIPVRADDPVHFLLWSSDEAIPVGLGLGFGVVFGQALLLTAIGMVFAWGYRKFKDNYPDGYFFHMLYAKGVIPMRTKKGSKLVPSRVAPNSFIRRFYP